MEKKQHVELNANPKSTITENKETKASTADDIVFAPATLPRVDEDKTLRKKRRRPSEFIQRTPNDVLCGRGIPIQNYHGNIRLHRIVDSFRDEYLATSRRDKPDLIRRIVAKVKEGGARFLKRKSTVENSRQDHWEEMDDSYAYEKVSHALRCRRYVDNSGNDTEAPHSADTSQPSSDIHLSNRLSGDSNRMWFLNGGPPYSTSSNLLSVETAQNPADSANIREAIDRQAQRRRLLEMESQRATVNTTLTRFPPGHVPMFGAPSFAFALTNPTLPQGASRFQSLAGLMDFPLRSSALYSNFPLHLRSPPNSLHEPYSSRGIPPEVRIMNDDRRDIEDRVDLPSKKARNVGEIRHTTKGGVEGLQKAALNQQHPEKGQLQDEYDHSALSGLSQSRNLGGHSSSRSMIGQSLFQWQLESRVPLAASSTASGPTGTAGLPSAPVNLSNSIQPNLDITSSITSARAAAAAFAPSILNTERTRPHPLSHLFLGPRRSLWTMPPELVGNVVGGLANLPSHNPRTNNETTTTRIAGRVGSSLLESEVVDKRIVRPSGARRKNDEDQKGEPPNVAP